MNKSKYRGVVVPMVTPVTQEGRPSHRKDGST